MWDATRRMAEAIGQGLVAEGVPHKLFHMAASDRNDVITEIFKIAQYHFKIDILFGFEYDILVDRDHQKQK
jgi:hypothetical protein